MLKLSDAFQIIRRELQNVAEEVANSGGEYDQCFVDHRAKVITERIFNWLSESEPQSLLDTLDMDCCVVNDLEEGI